MTLILAGLASLALSADPGFILGAVAEHCEPFVRGETSLEEARAQLVASGFIVEADESYADPPRVIEYGQEPPPDFPARGVQLRRPDGVAVSLVVDQLGPSCFAAQPVGETRVLTEAIERSGRWLRIPPRYENGRSPYEAEWLSTDGRLVLMSDIRDDPRDDNHEGDNLYAHARQAGASPEVMLAQREAAVSANQDTPGQALIWASQNWCLPRHGGDDGGAWGWLLQARTSGYGTMQGGHLRVDFRHRDPETLVAWVYGEPCIMIVHGPGREEATADLRAWLDGVESGWSRGERADVWTRPPGLTATLTREEYTEGPAMRLNVQYPVPYPVPPKDLPR